jgi:hypothetical protein
MSALRLEELYGRWPKVFREAWIALQWAISTLAPDFYEALGGTINEVINRYNSLWMTDNERQARRERDIMGAMSIPLPMIQEMGRTGGDFGVGSEYASYFGQSGQPGGGDTWQNFP